MTDDTRAHIRAVADRLGYRVHRTARALRVGGGLSIGLVTSYPADNPTDSDSRMDWYLQTANAAARQALEQECALVLIPPLDQEAWTTLLPIDGALVIDPDPDSELLKSLLDRRLPVVAIGSAVNTLAVASVSLDMRKAVEIAMHHLSAAGAKHPALVVDAIGRSSTETSLSAYRTWSQANGVEAVIATTPADERDRIEAGYRACSALLNAHPDIDGIYVPIDSIAAGCAKAVNRSHRTLGRDFHLITSEGKVASENTPPLSSIDNRRGEVAAAAVDLLISELRRRSTATSIVFEPTLIDRSQTGLS